MTQAYSLKAKFEVYTLTARVYRFVLPGFSCLHFSTVAAQNKVRTVHEFSKESPTEPRTSSLICGEVADNFDCNLFFDEEGS
jgi:hypothetical protein